MRSKENIPAIPYKHTGKLGFEILHFEGSESLGAPLTFHRHEFTELLFLEKGTARHSIDFREFEVHEGDLMFIPESCVHAVHGESAGMQAMLWLIRKDFLPDNSCAFLKNEIASFLPKLFSENSLYLLGLDTYRKLIESEYRNSEQDILRHLLLAFLKKLESSQEIEPVESMYSNFLQLLEKHYTEHQKVTFYAERLFVSSKTLNIKLRTASGMSASELINRRLLLEAKRLLSFSEKNIKETAFELGFSDPFYFSRFLKKHAGVSPKAFKDSLKKFSS